MTQRFLHFLTSWLFAVLALAALALPAQATEGIDVQQAHVEPSEDGHMLSASFVFELNHGLEEALLGGLPLSFTTTVELMRRRWYWFNENAVEVSQTVRISYNVLTRQYRAAIDGGLQQNFSTLNEVLGLIRRPTRWMIAPKGKLKIGETYDGTVQLKLDLNQLPKPFQVNALNNSDWRFSSDKKHFVYKAEER